MTETYMTEEETIQAAADDYFLFDDIAQISEMLEELTPPQIEAVKVLINCFANVTKI